jgi:DNA topoisomerase IB
MPRTRRSDPSGPGFGRVARGRGFSYCDEAGGAITDQAVLERIKALVIPPAWKDVWICADERGHIQAVGTDDAGRRQYLYHDDWRSQRDRAKFKRLPEFAAKLPQARRALEADLALEGLVRERVMACAVRLLDIGMFRVGGEDYAEENESYGLATIQKQHVRVKGGTEIEFDYIAKGGAPRSYLIADRLVVPTVKALKRRRGKPTDELLAYKESRGVWRDVSSAEINEWLKDLLGEEYTAKDFRTWNGTVLAAMLLADQAGADDQNQAVVDVIKVVAEILGNTPAVCRASYVDPRVISQFENGKTIKAAVGRLAKAGDSKDFADRAGLEQAVIRLIS